MTTLAEQYVRAFGADRFFGLDMVINWIADERVVEIEEDSDVSISEIEILVRQQWTDEKGYTWRKMSDGSTEWWNGSEWLRYGN